MAEKWEYFPTFIYASAEKDLLREIQKIRRSAAKYAPEAMMAYLDSLGEAGWELVHMQPVFVGKNDDVLTHVDTSGGNHWTQWYFCVFKRRKS